MGRYALRRLFHFIPVFFFATFLVYALVFAMPGDPIRALAGEKPVNAATLEAMRERFNLNDPLLIQYVKYIKGVFTGDLGTNFAQRPVWDILSQRIPTTVRLAIVAFSYEAILGVLAGVLAGLKRKGFMDMLVAVSTVSIISIPIFVLAYLAQYALGVQLGWFAVSYNANEWTSLILPALVLGSTSLAYIARLTRTSLAETLRADYVRTATAKGLSRRRVVGIHALRNSMIPVVTFLAVDIGSLMGGAIITEGVFNVPGIGREVFAAIKSQEGTVVVGIVVFLVVIFMVSNLIVDFLYAALDPRIRYE